MRTVSKGFGTKKLFVINERTIQIMEKTFYSFFKSWFFSSLKSHRNGEGYFRYSRAPSPLAFTSATAKFNMAPSLGVEFN
jgi:hypothetical protein